MINENKKGVKAVKHSVKAKNPIAVAHQKTGGSKSGVHKNKAKEIPRKTKHKSKPVEGWTTDTLAAELFEQDHSYEDRLQRMLEGKLTFNEAYQYDESNLWYRYDTTTGRLRQRMIHNLDEKEAHRAGYRDSIEDALRVANIIRSKFDPKKFIQKQGTKWIEVHPFGTPEGVSETLFSTKPTEGSDGGEEYNDEVGMIRNDLQTMIRCAKELERILSSNENVAEWAQEKIAVAKSMIVTILDYVASEHELGHKYTNK